MVHGRSDALLPPSDFSHLVDCVGRQSNAVCNSMLLTRAGGVDSTSQGSSSLYSMLFKTCNSQELDIISYTSQVCTT